MFKERERRNPFWEIIHAAKVITTRKAREEQPEEFEALSQALSKTSSEDTKDAALFRLMTQVIEEKAPIQGLYALAHLRHKIPVAQGASAVMKVLREGASMTDLEESGLAKLKTGKKPYYVYKVGQQALSEAAEHFREEGQDVLAQVLEEHLREGERRRRLAQARRQQKKKEATV